MNLLRVTCPEFDFVAGADRLSPVLCLGCALIIMCCLLAYY